VWLDALRAAGVPAAPVHDLEEALMHPQTKALDLFEQLAGHHVLSPPFAADGSRPRYRVPPPLLGQHTRAVLAEIGVTDGEVDGLVAAGVVGVS
jgi:crotonobetainyl-CoA:carnitine CoA-transferase CaiB-like acyl-CoA transferase